MENDLFFENIFKHERVIQPPGPFTASIQEGLAELKTLSYLQYKFILTEVVYAFKHFGLCSLGPLGRHLLSENLGKLSGVDSHFLGNALEAAAYDILAKQKILDMGNSELDWEELNKEFSIEWTKRAFITAHSNDFDFGLSAFDPQEVHKARQEAQCVLNEIPEVDSSPHSGNYLSFLAPLAQLIKADPLAVFAWRVEAMNVFCENARERFPTSSQDAKKSYKNARALSGLLSILMGLGDPRLAKDQFLQTPCRILDIEKRITKPRPGHQWDTALIYQWLGCTRESFKETLVALAEQAYKNGFLFQVKGGGVGLSSLGLQILAPHRDTILEQMVTGVAEPGTSATLAMPKAPETLGSPPV